MQPVTMRARRVESSLMPARRLTRQVVVRISDDLYEQLTQDAEENGRTVGQTIRFRLEQLYRDGDAG